MTSILLGGVVAAAAAAEGNEKEPNPWAATATKFPLGNRTSYLPIRQPKKENTIDEVGLVE